MTAKDYPGDGIVVHWDSDVCIHSGNCAKGLPSVFQPTQRPWINSGAASAEEIAATIDTCPSGALRYTRTDGGAAPSEQSASAAAAPDEESSSSATSSPAVVITAATDGPYLVKGPIEVRNGAGDVVETLTKAALCRCGASETKPFCDGSHKRIGFTAP